MRRTRLAVLIGLCVAALAAAACGGDDGGGGRTATVDDGRVTVEARDVAFDVERIETSPGALEVTLVQVGALQHTFVIEGIDEDTFKLDVNGNRRDTATVELDPGEYEYFCDVPGHRSQGMEGILVVE